jgi:hypothetical protein
VEYNWRVDHGFWTTWHRGPQLVIEHPSFLAQGWHTIEIRSRGAGDADTIEPHPVEIPFLVDWQPPEITLTEDTARGTVEVSAWDLVTPADRIQYAFQLGDSIPSGYGPARPMPLADISARGGKLVVYAKDDAGNVGTQTFRMAVATPPNNPLKTPAIAATNESGGGCNTAAGLIPALGALSMLSLAIRRRRVG